MDDTQIKYNVWHKSRNEAESEDYVLNNPWYVTVKSLIPKEFKGKILEIGCGRGDFSIYLAQKYPDAKITGIDFSQVAIDKANEKSKLHSQLNNLYFQKDDATKLSFQSDSYDLVISCETLEHVNNQNLMLKEIYRVLKTDGNYIITTENYFNGMLMSWIKSWITGTPFDSGSGVQPNENFMLFFVTYYKLLNTKFRKIKMLSNHYQWLLLPRIAPDKLCTKNFNHKWLKAIVKPFGRHFTYFGYK
jgi:ubiquinone/menaquinone biosynthesis C-methylase UbiE